MKTDLAEAKPSKTFFFEMFVRDITLEDCILDLIDNSIDSLIRTTGLDVSDSILKPDQKKSKSELPRVVVRLSKGKVSITDNCGGIPYDHAKEFVFRFGYRSITDKPQLGVYGIGLKRAVFKLGNDITITSRTEKDGFKVHIDEKWIRDEDNWKIPMERIQKADKKNGNEAGTQIVVTHLHQEIMTRLESGSIEGMLHQIVSKTYCFFLNKHVRVRINGNDVSRTEIPLGESPNIKPAIESFAVQRDSGRVKVTITASLAARDSLGRWAGEKSGWYAICNGRVVVNADKDHLTGWGIGMPLYHMKYAGFIGIVYFYSRDPYLLPWTTTKRGLNTESIVYQRAINRMSAVAKPVISFLNKMYPSDPLPKSAQRQLTDDVKQADTKAISSKQPTFFEIIEKPVPPEKRQVKIQYDALVKDVERINKHLRRSWPARRIGKYTFEHYLKTECEE